MIGSLGEVLRLVILPRLMGVLSVLDCFQNECEDGEKVVRCALMQRTIFARLPDLLLSELDCVLDACDLRFLASILDENLNEGDPNDWEETERLFNAYLRHFEK